MEHGQHIDAYLLPEENILFVFYEAAIFHQEPSIIFGEKISDPYLV